MGAGFLAKIFHPTHAACGCRPAITMCGAYTPGNITVEAMGLPEGGELAEWCQACLVVWMEQGGCGNCECGPFSLCELCQAALPAATD